MRSSFSQVARHILVTPFRALLHQRLAVCFFCPRASRIGNSPTGKKGSRAAQHLRAPKTVVVHGEPNWLPPIFQIRRLPFSTSGLRGGRKKNVRRGVDGVADLHPQSDDFKKPSGHLVQAARKAK